MPDGTLSHADAIAVRAHDAEALARADVILGLARQAFIEKGFEGASMRDLARAAGMSASNFYRYFPGKAALVEALIARDLAGIEEAFQAILSSPDPVAALKASLRERMSEDCDKDHPLWAEIIATAGRKPEVAAVLDRMHKGIAQRIARVLALARGIEPGEAEVRFGAHARMILLLVRGAAMENCADAARNSDLTRLITRTIEQLLDDAATDGAAMPAPKDQ